MGFKRGLIWTFARNTEWGRRQLGEETMLEKGVRHHWEGLMAVAIRRAYQNNRASAAQVGRDIQYVDGDVEVKVKVGYNRDYDCYVTDIIVKPLIKGWHGGHQHVIIDGHGRELMNEWAR
jgi:hypothetical protein